MRKFFSSIFVRGTLTLSLFLLASGARGQDNAAPHRAALEGVALSPEVANREQRDCVQHEPPFQSRSVWNPNLWPQGRVPYQFDANVTASERTAIRQAMDVLEQAAWVRFVPRAGEADYLHIQDSTGNNSFVGRIGGGQVVNIFNWNFRYIMAHELMHALGVWHEQMRYDRDTYITINLANVCQTCCSGGSCNHNFNTWPGTVDEGPYDFESVMHYSGTAFSTNGQPTIVCKPGYTQFQNVMGQRSYLSAGDRAGLISRYGSPTPVTWRRIPLLSPGSQSFHAMTFDAARNKTVMLPTGSPAATWTWDGSEWTTLATSSPDIVQGAMVFDSARGVSVMFGLFDAGFSTFAGRTWEWNGAAWTHRQVPGPSARFDYAMAYDSARGVTVLFGGTQADTFAHLSDLWEWNGTAWTQRSATGPTPRSGHAMAYDAARGVTVLFGGQDGAVQVDDVWEWNGSTWAQRASSGPPPRHRHAMAYDSARQRVVMYGGFREFAGSNSWDVSTWEWDGVVWTERSNPNIPSINGGAMAYDAARGQMLYHGGLNFTGPASPHLWSLEATGWEVLHAGGPVPPPRHYHAAAYDTLRGRAILHGGKINEDTLGDLWTEGEFGWSSYDESVYLRRHSMVYDSLRDRLVLFGGDPIDGDYSNNMWESDGSLAWTYINPAGAWPSPRYEHAMVFDEARGVSVMFGGVQPGNLLRRDTWTWNGAQWNNVSNSGPGLRMAHMMAYDSARAVVVLFGGWNGSQIPETWEWDGAAWSLRSTTGPARNDAGMAYDAARGTTILFGGDLGGGVIGGDLWEWNGVSWTQLHWTGDGPSPRYASTMHYDAARGYCVLVGGNTGAEVSNEMWVLEGPCTPVSILAQPASITRCPGTAVTLQAGVAGSVPRTYQWQAQMGGAGAWTPLLDGVTPGIGTVSGTTAHQLQVTLGADFVEGTQFRVVVDNSCTSGSVTSAAATLSACPADLNRDIGVDINDLLDFLQAFEAGADLADVSTGVDECIPDGGVDINDLLYFLSRFEIGC